MVIEEKTTTFKKQLGDLKMGDVFLNHQQELAIVLEVGREEGCPYPTDYIRVAYLEDGSIAYYSPDVIIDVPKNVKVVVEY